MRTERLTSLDDAAVEQLADVLVDCVRGGASVGFLLPFDHERAVTFWRSVAGRIEPEGRTFLVARDDDGAIVGTVQVVPAGPENQPHRADLTKMLVHRRARRQGIASALLRAAEAAALEAGHDVLVLDTVTGSDAHALYLRNGWTVVGEVPDFALWPDGTRCPTTFFTKHLDRTQP